MPLIRWLFLFQTFCTTSSVKYLEELIVLFFVGLYFLPHYLISDLSMGRADELRTCGCLKSGLQRNSSAV